MRFEFIEDTAGLRGLETAWRDLCARLPHHTVYQTFHWNRLAWEGCWSRRKTRLCVVVGRDGSRIRLILPLVVGRGLLWRWARSLGAVVCNYDDAVVEVGPDMPAQIGEALDRAAARHQIDICSFRRVRHDSALFHLLVADPDARRTHLGVAFVDWHDWRDWEHYQEGFSPRFRREIRSELRRLSAIGDLTFEVVETRADVEQTLHWLVDQKRKWLVRTGRQRRRFDSERGFLELLVDHARAHGMLCLARLMLAGEMIAAELGVLHEGIHSALITTYDPTWRRYSPGKVLFAHTLRWSQQSGQRIYDLNHDSQPYKSIWARSRVPMTGFVAPRTHMGRTVLAWERSSVRSLARKPYLLLPIGLRARIRDALTR